MLKGGLEYTDIGQQQYDNQFKERALKSLARKAKELGLQLAPSSRRFLQGTKPSRVELALDLPAPSDNVVRSHSTLIKVLLIMLFVTALFVVVSLLGSSKPLPLGIL